MMLPQNRLLIWFAWVVLPAAIVGGVVPELALGAGLAVSLFACLALGDALTAWRRASGLQLQAAPMTRMSKDREASIELRLRNPRQRALRLRLALAWPRAFQTESDELTLALPEGSEWSRCVWRCRPRERGRFQLPRARLGVGSALGFWEACRTLPLQAELRVYPNLLAERRHLAGLFLHRGSFGLHTQRQIGKGREFEKLREYVPGDGFDEIHWKATARRGRPITKVFQIERTQEIYIIIDTSRLSARPAPVQELVRGRPGAETARETLAPLTLERFITASLLLGLVAEQQGDLFGLITFSDGVDHFLRARNGKSHFNACRDALYGLQPRVVTPDFDEVCTFIRLRLRRRALLVFLTALDDPVLAESFVRNLELLRRQHLVLVNMIQPPGIKPLFSDPDVAKVDDLYQHLGGHLVWQKLRELEQVLHRLGVRFSLLQNERLSAQLASQYLSVKRRQAL